VLAFTSVYFSELNFFNDLQPIQIRKSRLPILGCTPGHKPALRIASTDFALLSRPSHQQSSSPSPMIIAMVSGLRKKMQLNFANGCLDPRLEIDADSRHIGELLETAGGNACSIVWCVTECARRRSMRSALSRRRDSIG
jgi:hypothetical protein